MHKTTKFDQPVTNALTQQNVTGMLYCLLLYMAQCSQVNDLHMDQIKINRFGAHLSRHKNNVEKSKVYKVQLPIVSCSEGFVHLGEMYRTKLSECMTVGKICSDECPAMTIVHLKSE